MECRNRAPKKVRASQGGSSKLFEVFPFDDAQAAYRHMFERAFLAKRGSRCLFGRWGGPRMACMPQLDALSARQHLDQPIQIFLTIEERLHQHAFVFAVHAHVVDIARQPGMAISRYPGIT
jgi:hypothetical protein